MKHLKKMSDFLLENQNVISSLNLLEVRGGKQAVGVADAIDTTNENYTTQCSDGHGTDTESWVYDDTNGRVPIKGTIDGAQVYP